ncbi:MAG: TIGR00366 family protein [Pseudomonadales bacterium]
MLERAAAPFVVFVERFYPDAFVFAILLTLVTFVMAVTLAGESPAAAVEIWGLGLTGLLSFIAQIALTLICAHALAHTDLVRSVLARLARLPRSATQGYALVAVVAGVGSLIAWSLGLVVGGLIALRVATVARERGLPIHYPLLVASAYAGFVVWHMGYSSSAALFVATPGHALESMTGIIPVTETIFAPWNLALAALTVVAVAWLCAAMGPDRCREYRGEADAADAEPPREVADTWGRWLETRRALSLTMGGLVLWFLLLWFAERGLNLTLDIVNWSFLGLGLVLARSPLHYVGLIGNASRTVGPIILQYPFYAGIMALMTGTALVGIISGAFVAISSPATLGFWAFLAAGVLNFFIPSGGGQWAVQGPIFIEAARQLDVAYPHIVMAVAYGDQWSNLIQPFWTIPLLAVAGLNMRAIMGYCFVVFAASGVLFGGALLLLGGG